MRTNLGTLRVSGLLLAGLLLACSGNSDATGPNGGNNNNNNNNNNTPNTVTIANFAFSPDTLTVTKGTTVTWQNSDAVTHTATADGGSFDTGHIASGASGSATFNTVGTFAYSCAIHPSMHGVIKVQ